MIDDKYTQFPYDLGARNIAYVVLGFYNIVQAWGKFETPMAACNPRLMFVSQRNVNLRKTLEAMLLDTNLRSNGAKNNAILGGTPIRKVCVMVQSEHE